MRGPGSLHIGTKIVIAFTIVSIIGFSLLNSLILQYFRKTLTDIYIEEASISASAHSRDNTLAIPQDIVIFGPDEAERGNSSDMIIIPIKYGVNRYYLKRSAIDDPMNRLSIILFVLESIIFICLLFITYQFTTQFISSLEESEGFLNLMLLSLNHKLGNFLSTQRINLELLRGITGENRQIERLTSAYTRIEMDIKRTLHLVKDRDYNVTVEVSPLDIVKKNLEYLEADTSLRNIFISKNCRPEEIRVRMDENDMEDVLFNLLDNALKYSKGYIGIRFSIRKGRVYIFIANDIPKERFCGFGLGLKIVQNILARYSGGLLTREKYRYLTVLNLPLEDKKGIFHEAFMPFH